MAKLKLATHKDCKQPINRVALHFRCLEKSMFRNLLSIFSDT